MKRGPFSSQSLARNIRPHPIGPPISFTVKLTFDPSHAAEALAAYDKANLYLAFRVRDQSPLANRGQQGSQYLFKSGDCVVFEKD